MPNEASTDLNVLMSLDPLELTRQDRDQIIAYQRKQRAQRESGVKVKKVKEGAPTVDIKALMGTVPKPTPGTSIRRRI
jgi:hypothetical protein